jgi:probable HAF family extracellular repeat protein
MFTNIIAMTLFAAMAMPVCVLAQGNAAQEDKVEKHEHHHYKLIDMGTLGGPNTFPQSTASLAINSRGLAVAQAETSIPEPFAPNCLQPPECLAARTITWQNGVQTDLGALPGVGNSSVPLWLNDQGTIVGISENGVIDPLTGSPEIRAVRWKGGKILDLGTLGGNAGYANAINNRGQVAGYALNNTPDSDANGLVVDFPALFFPATTQVRAVLWQDGVIHDLGTLGTGNDAAAIFVNERGQVAGVSFTDTILNASGVPTQDPFFWDDGKMVDIGTLGGTIGYPLRMNNRGQVVGTATLAGDQENHAFFWDEKEGLKDLGTLPGGLFSKALWINDAGEAVGFSDAAIGIRAVLWKNGAMIDLGSVAGDPCNFAQSINLQGQIVGFGRADCFNEDHTFLWENGGPLVDLQTLLVHRSDITLIAAIVINDRSEIVGVGILPNGDSHSVLLIPCDENHAGVEDCDFDTVAAETAAQGRPAQTAQASAAADFTKLSHAELTARFRSMTMRRYHRFGTPQTSPK